MTLTKKQMRLGSTACAASVFLLISRSSEPDRKPPERKAEKSAREFVPMPTLTEKEELKESRVFTGGKQSKDRRELSAALLRVRESIPLNQQDDLKPHRFLEGEKRVILEAGVPVAKFFMEQDRGANMTPAEMALIQEIDRKFRDDVGGSMTQDVESVEYFNRWRAALNRADEQLRIVLGWDRYNQLSALAAQRAYVVASGL